MSRTTSTVSREEGFCDRCGRMDVGFDPGLSLEDSGWHLIEGIDLCPLCAAEYGAWRDTQDSGVGEDSVRCCSSPGGRDVERDGGASSLPGSRIPVPPVQNVMTRHTNRIFQRSLQ